MKNKKSAYVIAVAAVLAFIGIVFYTFFAPGIMLSVTERTASLALDTDVTIESMRVSLIRGSIEISGIKITNMEGYDAEHILTVDHVRADFSPLSYLSGTLKIKEIAVNDVQTNIQQKGARINLLEFQSKLSRREAEEETDADAGIHYMIDIIQIDDVVLNLDMLGQKTVLPMEPIVLENIGTDYEINAPLLITRIFAAIISGAAKQVGQSVSDIFIPEDAGESIRGIIDRFRGGTP